MNLAPSPSLDLIADLRELTAFGFMVNALVAATIVAVLSAAIGWYAVLRREAFASHTLSTMAFPGAAGASLAGLPTSLGYYLACGAAALVISRRGTARAGRGGDGLRAATTGTVQAAGLALGFLFLSLNHAILSGPETLLFGSILGVSDGQVLGLLVVAAIALVVLIAVGRPLWYATVDADVARAGGVPVARLELCFLLLLAAAVAATSQITGALLVFALLIAPPAAAQALTVRPLPGLAISIGLALVISWLGLGVAYFSPYPVGFWVTTFAFAVYVLARAGSWLRRR